MNSKSGRARHDLSGASEFLRVRTTDQPPVEFVQGHGTIQREFAQLTQDSGNISWLVDSADGRLFLKTAGIDEDPPIGAPRPYFDHAGRVQLLRNATKVAYSCDHPALCTLMNVIESPARPILVYRTARGELIGARSRAATGATVELREGPAAAHHRFVHFAVRDQLAIFGTLIDLHRALADRGWVACDLYDGCLILDFATGALRVVDLDHYRRSPSVNDMGRMFGSDRFMAPEEFELGARLDQRTTVFNLGRLVWHFATCLTEDPTQFCGPPPLASIVRQAVQPDPRDRYPTVAAFAAAWQQTKHECI